MKSFKNLKQRLLAKNPLKRFVATDPSKNKNCAVIKSVVQEMREKPTAAENLSSASSSSALVPLTIVSSATNASTGLVKSATFGSDMVDSGASSISLAYSTTSFQPTYFSHYIGVTVISPDSNITGSASNCVGKIIQNAKQLKQKPRRVAIQISLKGFRILDCETSECLVETSIYRMIYFTVWQAKKSVFAFVYQNCNTKLFECHAFDCQTKFNAKFILRASFLMFNLAFEQYHNEKSSIKRMQMLQEAQAFCSPDTDDKSIIHKPYASSDTCRQQIRKPLGLCALQQILPNSSLILNNTLPSM